VNGLTLLALIALAIGVLAAYRLGRMHGRRERPPTRSISPAAKVAAEPAPPTPALPAAPIEAVAAQPGRIDEERARLVRSYEAEMWSLRLALVASEAEAGHLRDFAVDRRRLLVALADERSETARYRQVIVDIENNAPPPLLDAPGSPDDLKLIVGIGPVLERLLQQLGIGTYRQIARWSERDIDDFDAKLAEFPGRIRRDTWVTQARELHQSKFGERP
jgi:predicted flap endonuclease-1-like 5' DNA nuclease